MKTLTKKIAGKEYTINVRAWCGNVRPWSADVYCGVKYVGQTGFCNSESAALRLGIEKAQKHSAK